MNEVNLYNSKKCPACGFQVQFDSTKCIYCGADLTPEAPKSKKNKTLWWLFLGVLVLIAIIAVVFIFLR